MRLLQLILTLVCLVGLASASEANERGFDQCSEGALGPYVQSVCTGARPLPRDHTRNIRGHELLCSANSDSYIRRPQPFNFDDWQVNLQSGMSKKESQTIAQSQRQSLAPPPAWTGSIPYATTEQWTWDDCQYGIDPVCGNYQVCHDEPVTIDDGNGKSHQGTKRVCETEYKECFHDVPETERNHCSNEIMNYSLRYDRPPIFSSCGATPDGQKDPTGYQNYEKCVVNAAKNASANPSEWNPWSKGYYDVLPNKYDLMPGEEENVQVMNNSSEEASVSPDVNPGNAWNHYNKSVVLDSGSSACQNAVPSKHTTIVISTISRDTGKRTPNPYALPVDELGQDMKKYFQWTPAKGKDGTIVQEAKPNSIFLSNTAGKIVKALEASNRELEATSVKAKVASGNESNLPQSAYTQKMDDHLKKVKGTDKESTVLVEVWRERRFSIVDRRVFAKLYEPEKDVIVHNQNYYLTDDADKKLWDLHNLVLEKPDGSMSIYHPSSMFNDEWYSNITAHLSPGGHYRFEVRIYQAGVPFYLRSCADDPNPNWHCKAPVFTGLHRDENDYFSQPLVLKFKADPNVDDRGAVEKFRDFLARDW